MLERVQKIISNSGYCSRRKAEVLIEQGKVKVNNKTISLGDKADKDKDFIEVEGKRLRKEDKRYIIFNKPKGYSTTLKDPKEKKLITEFIKTKERVYPVGRLDKYSKGLLLLTNDGDFANKIMHPRYEIKKTYLVETRKPLSDDDLKKLRNGIIIEGKKTSKADVKKLEDNFFEITIHEGRNRIIRKMIFALNNSVMELERVKIGKLELGNLNEGKFRELKEKEKKLIFS